MVQVVEEAVLWRCRLHPFQASHVPVVELDRGGVVGAEGHGDLSLEHLIAGGEDVGGSVRHRLVVVKVRPRIGRAG